VVLQDPYALPFASNSVDIVVSSSVFEHAEFFWLLFIEVMRVLKPSGLLYLNVPANGDFHRYPVDCWRFYPDAGSALVRWAQRNDIPARLMESFVAEQDGDQWNDFVAVVLKDRKYADRYPKRILDKKRDFTNGKVAGSSENFFYQRRDAPEDRTRLIEIRRLATMRLPVNNTVPLSFASEDRSAPSGVSNLQPAKASLAVQKSAPIAAKRGKRPKIPKQQNVTRGAQKNRNKK
jgi:SAM-dependent methyltransferase